MIAIENEHGVFLLFKWECCKFVGGCPTVHVKVEFDQCLVRVMFWMQCDADDEGDQHVIVLKYIL